MGPTNSFVKLKQFVKLNINFCKEYGIKIMQNTLRYTDIKKSMIKVYNKFKNYNLYFGKLKWSKFFNVICLIQFGISS